MTEGACKSVVTARLKRSGQRWSERGLSGCLTVRALLLSERLRSSAGAMEGAYTREIRAALGIRARSRPDVSGLYPVSDVSGLDPGMDF